APATAPEDRFQDAGALGRALEKFEAQRRLQLGHAAIADVMRKLFDSETGRKRRLARSSSQVSTGRRRHPNGDDDDQVTPVQAIEIVEDTEPRSMLVEIHDQPTKRLMTPPGVRITTPDAPTIAASPLDVRFAERPRTATAEIVVRPTLASGARTWFLLAALIAIGIGVAAALGLT